MRVPVETGYPRASRAICLPDTRAHGPRRSPAPTSIPGAALSPPVAKSACIGRAARAPLWAQRETLARRSYQPGPPPSCPAPLPASPASRGSGSATRRRRSIPPRSWARPARPIGPAARHRRPLRRLPEPRCRNAAPGRAGLARSYGPRRRSPGAFRAGSELARNQVQFPCPAQRVGPGVRS